MLGRAEITDGTLTVTNICTESGVSRASHYRSPFAAAIKEILHAPQPRRLELDELRHQVKHLKKTERDLRREHATEVRELTATIRTYANQIQALTWPTPSFTTATTSSVIAYTSSNPPSRRSFPRASQTARHKQ